MLSFRHDDIHRLTVKQHPAADYEVVAFCAEYFPKSTIAKSGDLACDLLLGRILGYKVRHFIFSSATITSSDAQRPTFSNSALNAL